MTALQTILDHYRFQSQTEREKGNYFEELIRTWFRYEASYADLYDAVWLFADWAKEIGTPQFGISAKDTGIDLVARTRGTGEFHAIQCKCYAADHRVTACCGGNHKKVVRAQSPALCQFGLIV